jgi:hypothetical protein
MQDIVTNSDMPKKAPLIPKRVQLIICLYLIGILLLFLFAGPLWAIAFMFVMHIVVDL